MKTMINEDAFNKNCWLTPDGGEYNGESLCWDDYNAYAFGFYAGCFLVEKEKTHNEMVARTLDNLDLQYLDEEEYNTYTDELNEWRANYAELEGRFWKDSKVIAFWDKREPHSEFDVKFLIDKIRYEVGINVSDFVVVDSDGNTKVLSQLFSDNNSKDNNSKSMRFMQSFKHVASPLVKGKPKVPRGRGSNYRPKDMLDSECMAQYHARKYPYGESRKLNKIVVEQIEKFLLNNVKINEDVDEVICYHGSGRKFDKFNHAYMGSGEGAQAHGYGTYVTLNKDIANMYTDAKSNSSLYIERIKSDISRLKEVLPFRRGEAKEQGEEQLKKLELELENAEMNYGRFFYEVEIPENNGMNYIEEEDLVPHSVWIAFVNKFRGENREWAKSVMNNYINEDDFLWRDFIKALGIFLYTPKKASQFLYKLGYVGIHYYGRVDGECYVIFNENDIKINNVTKK